MKKIKAVVLLALAVSSGDAQVPGEWIWMNSDSTLNFTGSYGIMGIPSPGNKPPAVYEATEWTDNQNNFWFYGGENDGIWYDDLWKYNVASNEWTWIKGSGGLPNQRPIYGQLTIASITNSPGERCTSQSWFDNQGNLWLFGGISYYGMGTGGSYNDLWKYNIATNMWTWMKGDTTTISGGQYGGNYGNKGMEDTLNCPSHFNEMDITWTDNNDNLWMLDPKGCLWEYKTATNNWIWKNGDTTGVVEYGQLGVASLNTTPGNEYFAYTRWKDSNNNFWFLSSRQIGIKVLFKYEISSNMWTWILGDTVTSLYNSNSNYGDTTCNYTFINGHPENVIPFSRCEARACWIDDCDNLWLMGGWGNDHSSTYGELNDLIYFDKNTSSWIWAGNDTTHNYNSVFGTMGISSPLNKPAARSGAVPFKDANGNLWCYGGINGSSFSHNADLWKYTMNNGCTPCSNPFTDTHEILMEDKITIYPNPSARQITIAFSQEQENTFIKIVSILGGEIGIWELKNTDRLEIARGKMSNGIYFVQIIDENKNVVNRKIIIQ